MSITRKDILDHARGTEKQKEMFEYWDEQPEQKDPRLVSPLEMVDEYQKVAGQLPSASLAMTMLNCIQEEYEEFLDAGSDEDELKEMADLVYVIYGKANALGWDLDEAVRRVHENNMGRMYQPDGSIKRREDGKILRNKDYPSVDLSDLVE